MKNIIIIILLLIIVALAIGIFLPVMPNGSSFLRRCKFNESTGSYDRCYWLWDKNLPTPSIYF